MLKWAVIALYSWTLHSSPPIVPLPDLFLFRCGLQMGSECRRCVHDWN